MLRAIIIDDERSCVETLAIEIRAYCPDVTVVGQYTSAPDGLKAIQSLQPDLVFLDIEMPFMNAFELLEQCHPISFDVIFVTAYDQYAVRAFDVNAVDYLLKPVQKLKLIDAVNKTAQKREHGLTRTHLEAIVSTIRNATSPLPNIALPTIDGYEFVKVDQIMYAEAESNYTHIHLVTRKKHILSRTLKEVEAMLTGHHFVRIHQSFLVNLTHVSKYMKGAGGYVILTDGSTLNVSRTYKSRLLQLIRR
ncbi:MAG: LytTR family DNA-binding domain-containing protein [Saprospiraceae bacterium]|nr:LytTR family DNA-binding domain-containing protein [Saprospiraceae bacterium]